MRRDPRFVPVDVYALVDSPGWWNMLPSITSFCINCGRLVEGAVEPHGHVLFGCVCGTYVRAFADN